MLSKPYTLGPSALLKVNKARHKHHQAWFLIRYAGWWNTCVNVQGTPYLQTWAKGQHHKVRTDLYKYRHATYSPWKHVSPYTPRKLGAILTVCGNWTHGHSIFEREPQSSITLKCYCRKPLIAWLIVAWMWVSCDCVHWCKYEPLNEVYVLWKEYHLRLPPVTQVTGTFLILVGTPRMRTPSGIQYAQ